MDERCLCCQLVDCDCSIDRSGYQVGFFCLTCGVNSPEAYNGPSDLPDDF